MKSLFILGRQPALGLAELESLYGADVIAPLGENALACELDAKDIAFSRLGGSQKLAQIWATLDFTGWDQITRYLTKELPGDWQNAIGGKLTLGLSAYGFDVSPHKITATALSLKKQFKAKTSVGSVRIVPNKEVALNSAQVLHNRLTGPQGLELVLVRHEDKTILAQTIAEQDIEAYARRDQNRPKRDARVGMLPPKLAQVIVNLATSSNDPHLGGVLLDPFCGTGVVLQEATLIGFDSYGTDIEPRMIEYTEKNLQWLHETHQTKTNYFHLEQGDATSHTWNIPKAIHYVACEGYLGQPFSAFPSPQKLAEVTNTCNKIMKAFLKNIASQIEPGTRLCIALPAWHKSSGQFVHLKLLDELEDLGYNRMSFVHVRDKELLYYRETQVVARELLVITRK